MYIVESGHTYQLECFDGFETLFLTFVKREGEKYPGNVGTHPGTNCQDVLRVLIDRIKYLDGQIPDATNSYALKNLRYAIYYMELRAAKRHGRILPEFPIDEIELQSTCPKCGHVGCIGQCRA